MADSHCALCGRARAQCTRLVEGERGSLCIDCVAPAVTAFEGGESIALTLAVVEDVLAHLSPSTPTARAKALLDAAAALSEGVDATLRRIAAHALRVSQPAAAIALLERIVTRTSGDAISIAVACWHLGRVNAGIAALEGVGHPDTLAMAERIAAILVQVGLRLESDRAPAPHILDELRRQLEEARAAAERYLVFDANSAREYLLSVAELRALCALRGSDPTGALAALEAGRRHGEHSPLALLIEGDARAALGDHRAASEAWTRAWKAAHPDSREALEARRRFSGPYR